MSGRQRLTFAAIAAAIAVAAVVILVTRGGSGDDVSSASQPAATSTPAAGGAEAPDDTPTATSTPAEEARAQPVRIVVKGGQPVGGVEKIRVDEGERIAFTVRSDAADEVHVHGYDVEKELPAGGRAAFDFKATITGVFEVELHGSGTQIASLTVNP